jgi:4-amino-4-deoxy-L-arabinose transferase-like glycosyltransferase
MPETQDLTLPRPALAMTAESGELRKPEKSPVDLLLACAMALVAALWVMPLVSYIGGADEGITLQGAIRILGGELPYRDFFSFYTPGTYYIHAAVFRIFGTSLLAARMTLVVYSALYGFLTYLLARRVCSRSASLLAAGLVTLISLPARFAVVHNWDSTTAALAALYCAVWLLETSAAPWAFLCGLFAGTTLMIEQSKGAGLLLGLTISGILLVWMDRQRWKLRHLVFFLIGVAMPCLLVIGYFARQHALSPMLAAWAWPFQHYSAVNKLPYGFLIWNPGLREVLRSGSLSVRVVTLISVSPMILIACLPLLVVALWFAVLVRVLLKKSERTPLVAFIVLTGSVVSSSLLAMVATGRPDFFRLIYLTPLFFPLVPMLFDSRLVWMPSLAKLQPVLAVLLLISFSLCDLVVTWSARQHVSTVISRRGIIHSNEVEELLPYMQAHIAPGARILIYPYMPNYYFLTGTYSATRFEYLQVAMHTRAQFEAAITEVRRDKTPVVIFDLSFRDLVAQAWPATPAEALANDPMGDFVFSHYHACKTLLSARRPFEYMVRNGLVCPQ